MLTRKAQFRGLFWLLIVIAIFNTVDYFATQDLVVYGVHHEWNPLMRRLVGTPYFVVYKLVVIPIGLAFLWLMRRSVVPKYMGLLSLTGALYTLLTVYTWVVFYF